MKQPAIWKGKSKTWRKNSVRNKDPEKELNGKGNNYFFKKRQKEIKKKRKKIKEKKTIYSKRKHCQ